MRITPQKFPNFVQEVNFTAKSILFFGPEENLLSFKISELLENLKKNQSFEIVNLDSPPDSLLDLPLKEVPTLFHKEDEKKIFIISGIKDKFFTSQ